MKDKKLQSMKDKLEEILQTVEETQFVTDTQKEAIENLEFEIYRLGDEILDDIEFENDFEDEW